MIIQRSIYAKIEPYLDSPEAVVITGMRRTGKTTLLQFIYDKIPSGNKLILDLENPLNQKYFEEEDFEKIKFNLEVLGLNFAKKTYLFLDEIQLIKNLPQAVKYLADHYQVKFFLTGSSNFYLKNLFSESLAGRKYVFELFPLDFQEFLLLKGEHITSPPREREISETVFRSFERFFEEYLRFGGFPGVVAKESFEEKKMALEDIFASYFQLEVIQLGDYRKTSVVRDLMLLLMQRIGSKIDIQKIASELGVSRPTVYDYLSFLEGTYFTNFVPLWSKSKDVEIRGSEKVYLCDVGLANILAKVPDGALYENAVFQLLRPRGHLYYYQKKGGAEIDFILDGKEAYEIKLRPSASEGKKLEATSKELGIRTFHLVSLRYSTLPHILYGFNL